MLRSFIEAVVSVVAGIVERLFRESRTATDADRDVPLLRRAGSRLGKWLHKGGTGTGEQPDQDGAECAREDLCPRERQVDRK